MLLAHQPLLDPIIQQTIIDVFHRIQNDNVNLSKWNNNFYFDAFRNWISSSQHNKFSGINSFSHEAYSHGTTESIQSFIHRHGFSKRIRFSRAEFTASKIVCNHASLNWKFLEDDKLSKKDALIMSLPFSGTGNVYDNLDDILNSCDALEIPVLIDASYFGISHSIKIDLSRSCITDLVFSLSKPFSTQLRLGYRLTKNHFDDIVQSSSDIKIYNRYAAFVGIELLKSFDHDWLIKKYRPIQEKICNHHDLEPSLTFTLASDRQRRKEFFRQNYYRVCITDELHQSI